MARLIPSAERIKKARALIQKARDLVPPAPLGRNDFTYIAQVKAYLQEARDLIKFIPKTPSATPEMKQEVILIFEEAERANHEILHMDFSQKDL